MRAWLALFLVVVVAGCTQQPAAVPVPPGPVILADLTSTECEYNDIIFPTPRDDLRALLPPGFEPRAFFGDEGAIVINFFACGTGFAWMGADMFTLVEAPDMPEIVETFDADNRTPRGGSALELDLYMLAAHTDHEGLRAVFERAGLPVGGGFVTKDAPSVPRTAVAQGRLADGEGALASYVVTGTQTAELAAHHRQWAVTDEGIVLIERYMSNEGAPLAITQGAARCDVSPRSVFGMILKGPCALGQDILDPMGWTGRAYLFRGVGTA